MSDARGRLEELFQIVSSVPRGRCASYGSVGRALSNPVSGYLVGRWMASCPEDIPWWRIVARDGRLPLWKRDPNMSALQRTKLEAEGIRFIGDHVDMEAFGYEP
ncbi:MAG TPA: MGMT family protein [Fimbriimonadaceae bacterium]|nr:MGMT family protein [Fimbriimonadaceae bacterium]